jgi:hypothetical protein
VCEVGSVFFSCLVGKVFVRVFGVGAVLLGNGAEACVIQETFSE